MAAVQYLPGYYLNVQKHDTDSTVYLFLNQTNDKKS